MDRHEKRLRTGGEEGVDGGVFARVSCSACCRSLD